MRIAVCGSEASGKTTLCESIAAIKSLPVLGDVRLDVLNEFPYDTLFEVERVHPGMWERLVQRQWARESEAGDCVIDTPVLDAVSLWIRWGWNRSTPETCEKLLGAARDASQLYSHVVLMPAVQVAPYEKRRFRHPSNAAHMNGIVEALLARYCSGCVVHRLDPGSPEEVLTSVLSFLDG